MRAGDRVEHVRHGVGTVLWMRPGGTFRIRFDGTPDLPRTVERKELLPIDRVDPEGEAAPAKERTTSTRSEDASLEPESRVALATRPAVVLDPQERIERVQTIEALRLGVVPAHFVRDYTVARETELRSLDVLLEARQGLRVLWGDYGHGKTHLLEMAERVAHDHNFVTARITLDPAEVPATHPKRLYRAIISSLRYREGAQGLDPIMHHLVDSAEHREPDGAKSSRFLSPYLWALHRHDEELIGWVRDYISGDHIDGQTLSTLLMRAGWPGQRVLTLSDYRTYGRMYVHLLGTIASWAQDAGFPGLLLLFDEVEAVDQLSPARLEYGRQNLMHFAAVTLEKQLLGFDLETQLYRGGHDVHRKIPLRFADDQPLSVVFAMTPLPDIETLFRELVLGDGFDVKLRPLSTQDLAELVARILALYEQAYPGFKTSDSQRARLGETMLDLREEGQSGVREIVRGTVLSLDSFRLGAPEQSDDWTF